MKIIITKPKFHVFVKYRVLVLAYQCSNPPTLLGVVEREKETGHYLEYRGWGLEVKQLMPKLSGNSVLQPLKRYPHKLIAYHH